MESYGKMKFAEFFTDYVNIKNVPKDSCGTNTTLEHYFL